jgi:serpin (serine protease inhibitor)
MTTGPGRITNHEQGPGRERPFSFAEGKETFEAILARINDPANDVHNADFWALERGEHAGDVSNAIRLDAEEAKKLTDELKLLPPGLSTVILSQILPQRLKPAQKGGIVLTESAAAELNALSLAKGLSVGFVAREPVLPLATPMMPGGPVARPTTAPIEGIAAIGDIKASAPVDAKLVARFNEISSMVMAHEAGKGKNVLASVVNILDMIAPVAVSLLPAHGDDPGTAAMKQTTLKAMKKDLDAEHLSDQALIHQLQVIHSQLLQFKGMITLGNEIAVDSGRKLRPEVEEAVKKGFGAEIVSLPMKRDPGGSADKMNAYIEKETTVYGPPEEGSNEPKKIKDGLKDVVSPDFVQALDAASISTFTGLLDWRVVFDEKKTEEQAVTSADGTADQKKLMTLETGYRVNPETKKQEKVPKLDVAEDNGFIFVKMPYDDKVKHSEEESRWGPPPSRIYRVIGAPTMDAPDRHTGLSKMIPGLADKDPLRLHYRDRDGKVTLARIQAEGKADPFDLLEAAGVHARDWEFPLLEGRPVSFTQGIHKGAAEDTEKGTIVQFVTVGGLESLSIRIDVPFELKTDVPYYNAIVVDLKDARGQSVPLKVAEWTIENFKEAKEPTSQR